MFGATRAGNRYRPFFSRVSRSDYEIEFMVGGSPSNVFGEKVEKKRSTTKMEHGSANCA